MTGGLDIFKAVASFILVLALLFLALKGLGRLRVARAKGQGGFMSLKGTLALGGRQYLAAVEAGGRLLIVGVSPDRITPIADWPAFRLPGEGEGQ